MRLLKSGFRLSLVALLNSCTTTSPPPFNFICTGDGFGGADCKDKNGSRTYRGPGQLQNVWITDQESINRFGAWCYRTKPEELHPEMDVHFAVPDYGKGPQ